jgi:hypothetical protein
MTFSTLLLSATGGWLNSACFTAACAISRQLKDMKVSQSYFHPCVAVSHDGVQLINHPIRLADHTLHPLNAQPRQLPYEFTTRFQTTTV